MRIICIEVETTECMKLRRKWRNSGRQVKDKNRDILMLQGQAKKEDFRRQVGKSDHGKWVQSVDWVTESWVNRRFGGEESSPKVWIQAALVPTTFTESESA